MTRTQYEREQRLRQARAREAEIDRLRRASATSDPNYVSDVVDFLWFRLLRRKLQAKESLPPIERARLETLSSLYA
jgi:hypothetical protein